jgi:hypothetical protein
MHDPTHDHCGYLRMAMNERKTDPWPNGEQLIHHDAVNKRGEASTSVKL